MYFYLLAIRTIIIFIIIIIIIISDGTLSTSQIIFSTKLSNLLHDDLIFLIQGFDPSATRPTYTARINIAVDSLLQNGFQLLTKAAVLLYIGCTSFAD